MHTLDIQLVRFPAALLAAAFITTILFFLMHLMVHSDDQRIQEATVIPVVDATMPDIKIEPPRVIERPEPIVEPPVADTPVETRESAPGSGPILTLATAAINLDPPGWNSLAFQDSDMVPIVRTTPVYPTRALQRRIEGFVLVSFSVDEQGNVVDPTVTYAEPEGVFDRAALQSIAKWRYTAKVVNGQPVPVHGVQQRIVFELAD